MTLATPPDLARIPAGDFLMGSSNAQDDERPVHRVYVSEFFISRFSVTHDEYARFIQATGQGARAPFSGAFSMAVPKRKTSPSRRGMRRSADALKAPTYVEDKDSGELRRPHHVDLKTGMYRGRQVLKVKTEA